MTAHDGLGREDLAVLARFAWIEGYVAEAHKMGYTAPVIASAMNKEANTTIFSENWVLSILRRVAPKPAQPQIGGPA